MKNLVANVNMLTSVVMFTYGNVPLKEVGAIASGLG